MILRWWWETPTNNNLDYTSIDVPNRDYAVGLLAAELNDGPAYEAEFIGKVLTGLALKNYAEVADRDTSFHVHLT